MSRVILQYSQNNTHTQNILINRHIHAHTHTDNYSRTYICVACVHMTTNTTLWVLWCATLLSFPCRLAVPSGCRWLMMAMARQIIWVAPSTQDVNQISFANDSQTLIWQPWPEPHRILHRGTKETSISPRTILFDHPFQGLMLNSSKISRWKRGSSV